MDEIGLVTNTVQPHNTSTCVTTLRQTTSVSAVQCETPHFFPSGPCAPWVVEPLAPYEHYSRDGSISSFVFITEAPGWRKIPCLLRMQLLDYLQGSRKTIFEMKTTPIHAVPYSG
jgi:hypothetical protein